MNQLEKYKLSLSGEYAVCSELLKKGFLTNLTYGNCKSVDIIVTDDSISRKSYFIEVKTTREKTIVTSFFQKYKSPNDGHPDFWIFVYIDKADISHFFVLTHIEVAQLQMQRNGMNTWEYIKGVDNLKIESLVIHENKWDKIKF